MRYIICKMSIKNRYADNHVSVCITPHFSQSSILYVPILALIFEEYKRYFGEKSAFYKIFTACFLKWNF